MSADISSLISLLGLANQGFNIGNQKGQFTGSNAGDSALIGGLAATGFGLPVALGLGIAGGKGGGGLFGGGGGTDSGEIQQTNPAIGILANLLGMGAVTTNEGGIRLGGNANQAKKWQFAQPLFTPEILSSITRDLLGGPNAYETAAQDAAFGGGIATEPLNWLTQLANTATEGALEGINTGFLTDVEPVIDAARAGFVNDTAPRIAQGFNFLSNSGFGAEVGARGARLAEEEARLRFQAEEAAAGRKLSSITGAAPTAAGLQTTAANFPLALASSLYGLGGADRASSQGGRTQQLLAQLLGLSAGFGNSAITIGPSGGSSAAALNGLAQTLPSIGQSLSGLLGGGSGSGSGVTNFLGQNSPLVQPPSFGSGTSQPQIDFSLGGNSVSPFDYGNFDIGGWLNQTAPNITGRAL